MSLVERADINEAGLVAIREQNIVLMNERNSLVYQLEDLQQEVSSLQRMAEVTMGQLYFWNDAAHQRQFTLDEHLKIITSLKTKLQSAESDFIGAVEELDEQKEPFRKLLEWLKIQLDTVVTSIRELKTGVVLRLYQQLMLPNDPPPPIDSITKSFQKLGLLCQPDQGGTQEAIVPLQRARRI